MRIVLNRRVFEPVHEVSLALEGGDCVMERTASGLMRENREMENQSRLLKRRECFGVDRYHSFNWECNGV